MNVMQSRLSSHSICLAVASSLASKAFRILILLISVSFHCPAGGLDCMHPEKSTKEARVVAVVTEINLY
jgi:hypothetical protein